MTAGAKQADRKVASYRTNFAELVEESLRLPDSATAGTRSAETKAWKNTHTLYAHLFVVGLDADIRVALATHSGFKDKCLAGFDAIADLAEAVESTVRHSGYVAGGLHIQRKRKAADSPDAGRDADHLKHSRGDTSANEHGADGAWTSHGEEPDDSSGGRDRSGYRTDEERPDPERKVDDDQEEDTTGRPNQAEDITGRPREHQQVQHQQQLAIKAVQLPRFHRDDDGDDFVAARLCFLCAQPADHYAQDCPRVIAAFHQQARDDGWLTPDEV